MPNPNPVPALQNLIPGHGPKPRGHQRISVCLPPELIAQLDQLAPQNKRGRLIADLLTQALNPWTPATTPPPKSGDYLTWVVSGGLVGEGEPMQDFCRYNARSQQWQAEIHGDEIVQVSYWMPKPPDPPGGRV